MPFRYVRDDTRHRIRITLVDPVTVDERIASIERQLADGAWGYGLLVDARAITSSFKPNDILLFRSRIAELVAAHGPRGPIAIIAKGSSAISGAQMFVFSGEKAESIEVFWDLDDGQQWLDEQLAKARKAPEST